eukprot:CAMPEP_0113943318 /NCGR_PEP_ID=MMETSP1339-20121228/23179_1 /TAXON_ID=94617 /ORGANISM="Fibrocapsa japonica" /LENGTH=328 /DNA_ID=CAMNT_0000948159 /DNA_START=82 /DNA_END=1068 /DNA_ORIENTATION=+ /assembly_acc=CAM_ASM_000762
MLKSFAKRAYSSSAAAATKVAVVGAAGGIGQPLSLLLKQNPKITELSLYDVAPVTPGVAADLSHISTEAKVKGFTGDQLGESLKGAEMVIIPAGMPRKPGMSRDDLFATNANIIYSIADACAKNCPDAWYMVICNPVNSTVPIFKECLVKNGVYNPKRLFGVTTLDITRAKTFIGENQGIKCDDVKVDVVGGHAGATIMPILSQVPGVKFSDADIEALTDRIQNGGTEVVKAKAGGGSATLSMAYAGAEFMDLALTAKQGGEAKACAFVDSPLTDAPFFSSPVTMNSEGIKEIHDFRPLSAFEQKIFDENIPTLIKQAEKGVAFAATK